MQVSMKCKFKRPIRKLLMRRPKGNVDAASVGNVSGIGDELKDHELYGIVDGSHWPEDQ